jgi:hypothetical protein
MRFVFACEFDRAESGTVAPKPEQQQQEPGQSRGNTSDHVPCRIFRKTANYDIAHLIGHRIGRVQANEKY